MFRLRSNLLVRVGQEDQKIDGKFLELSGDLIKVPRRSNRLVVAEASKSVSGKIMMVMNTIFGMVQWISSKLISRSK